MYFFFSFDTYALCVTFFDHFFFPFFLLFFYLLRRLYGTMVDVERENFSCRSRDTRTSCARVARAVRPRSGIFNNKAKPLLSFRQVRDAARVSAKNLSSTIGFALPRGRDLPRYMSPVPINRGNFANSFLFFSKVCSTSRLERSRFAREWNSSLEFYCHLW